MGQQRLILVLRLFFFIFVVFFGLVLNRRRHLRLYQARITWQIQWSCLAASCCEQKTKNQS